MPPGIDISYQRVTETQRNENLHILPILATSADWVLHRGLRGVLKEARYGSPLSPGLCPDTGNFGRLWGAQASQPSASLVHDCQHLV
jgi:hypothetical protein